MPITVPFLLHRKETTVDRNYEHITYVYFKSKIIEIFALMCATVLRHFHNMLNSFHMN